MEATNKHQRSLIISCLIICFAYLRGQNLCESKCRKFSCVSANTVFSILQFVFQVAVALLLLLFYHIFPLFCLRYMPERKDRKQLRPRSRLCVLDLYHKADGSDSLSSFYLGCFYWDR